jgi:hypothetical protein
MYWVRQILHVSELGRPGIVSVADYESGEGVAPLRRGFLMHNQMSAFGCKTDVQGILL